MEHFFRKFTKNLTKILVLSIFLVVYIIVFWYLFFNKGIYLDGHFYKKSANLTQVTYSASSIGADFDKITLKKYMDKSIITADDKFVVTVYENHIETKKSDGYAGEIPDENWRALALQETERIRGFGSKPWFLVVPVYILFFFAKKYNVQLYSFFRRGRAAGEKYYRYFDILFSIFCVAVLIYLILPI